MERLTLGADRIYAADLPMLNAEPDAVGKVVAVSQDEQDAVSFNRDDNPRIRVREADPDAQVLAIYGKMRIDDDEFRDWFRAVLISQTKDSQDESRAKGVEFTRQEALLVAQQDKLLDLRLRDEVDEQGYAAKRTQMRDRLASTKLQRDALDRSHDEVTDLAGRVFELSQTLTQKWLSSDVFEKRRILEIVFLNCTLDDVTLVPTIRKPFDLLAKGLVVSSSRAGGI